MAHDPAGVEADAAAARLAAELDRRGIGTAASLLADAHRPLAPLLSDLGSALGPLLSAVGGRSVAGLRPLLEDPRALDRLSDELDRRRDDAESR